MNRVESLKKISIRLQTSAAFDKTSGAGAAVVAFDFIFGLAPGGLTPFEYELIDKTEGEPFSFYLNKKDAETFFEYLTPRITDLFDDRQEVGIEGRVTSISSVDNRQIIRAMAEMTAGHGGDGCGCG